MRFLDCLATQCYLPGDHQTIGGRLATSNQGKQKAVRKAQETVICPSLTGSGWAQGMSVF